MREAKKAEREKKFMLRLFSNSKKSEQDLPFPHNISKDSSIRQNRKQGEDCFIPSTMGAEYQVYDSYKRSIAESIQETTHVGGCGKAASFSCSRKARKNLNNFLVI